MYNWISVGVQKLMCGCAMFAPRNHVSQGLYFGIDCVYGPIVRKTVQRFSRPVVIYLFTGDFGCKAFFFSDILYGQIVGETYV